jgi:tripartite-type tricarboxylate transporter receptor subunit TctC
MKPVIIFAEKRDPNFPNVPTSVELGHKVTLPQFRAIMVRAGTDPKIFKRLADALAEAVRDPEYAAYLKEQYADANSFVPAAKTKAYLDNELKAMKQLIASSGVTKEPAAAPTATK